MDRRSGGGEWCATARSGHARVTFSGEGRQRGKHHRDPSDPATGDRRPATGDRLSGSYGPVGKLAGGLGVGHGPG